MRRLIPSLALLLTVALNPSAIELAENALHWAATGHGAHGLPAPDHAPADPEHGCSGAVHVCLCHATAGFVSTPATSPLGAAPTFTAAPPSSALDPRADGHAAGVFRPPIL